MNPMSGSIRDMKEYLQGESESVEDKEEREEYLDRLGAEVEPASEPIRRGSDMFQRGHNFARAAEESLNYMDVNPSHTHGIVDTGAGRTYHRTQMEAPTHLQFRTYSGDREYMSQKLVPSEYAELLHDTENTSIGDVVQATVDHQLQTLLQEAQRMVYNLITENSDRLDRSATQQSRRMVHGAIDLMMHGYFLRMQEFMNFGYRHRISTSPERFSEMLYLSVFTVINGEQRECTVNIPLEM